MRSWAMTFAGFGVVALAAGGTASLVVARNHAEAKERTERKEALDQGPLVEVGDVKKASPTREVTVPGEVHALVESTIYAKVAGYLKLIHVDKGDHVKKDEVLGIIEAPEVEAQATAQRADLAVKRLTESRDQMLLKTGLLSQQDLDQAAANANISSASLLQLDTLSGYQVIRAPFDGVITARFADPGALLQAATQSVSALPLVSVANIDRVRVQTFLAQAEALFVREGDHVTVWAQEKPDTRADATVTRMTKELDAKSRTMLTEIEMDNTKTGFYPGTVIRVRLSIAMPEAVSVASDSIAFSGGKYQVALVRDDRVHFSDVQVIDTNGIDTRIREGVKLGDVVIRHPSDDIIEGVKVRIAAPKK
jgi:membrane fusion protein, multidrug efflux system